jgi:hypothetical protein
MCKDVEVEVEVEVEFAEPFGREEWRQREEERWRRDGGRRRAWIEVACA